MISLSACLLLAFLCVKVVYTAPPSEGKQIADQFGDDLSFASKQIIRGFTAIFAPILDTAQNLQPKYGKANGHNGEAVQNFQKVLLRDGLNAVGKGVKASATILTVPARVAGTGLDEFRKVGQAGLESRLPVAKVVPVPGNVGIDDKTKIASTLLNTTASQFSQANLGAVLVEVALKKRIKHIANQTGTYVKPKPAPEVSANVAEQQVEPLALSATNVQEQPTTPSRVDAIIEKFNEAVKNNDERVLAALQVVLAQINPPKQ